MQFGNGVLHPVPCTGLLIIHYGEDCDGHLGDLWWPEGFRTSGCNYGDWATPVGINSYYRRVFEWACL